MPRCYHTFNVVLAAALAASILPACSSQSPSGIILLSHSHRLEEPGQPASLAKLELLNEVDPRDEMAGGIPIRYEFDERGNLILVEYVGPNADLQVITYDAEGERVLP